MMQHIRPWLLSDAHDIALLLNNKKVLDNLRDGIPYPYTEADAEYYINSVLSAPADTQYAWAIHSQNKAIGSIGLFRQDNIHYRTAELGYYLAEPYWGKGIVAHAVREACQYVFENTNIVRIFAEPFARNTASCRVLEKAGFCYEGTLRNNAEKNGELLGMKMYALIRE